MATSGSIDFSLNARDVCTYALQELRVIGSGETPSDDDIDDVKRRLNLMLKSWQVETPNIWRRTTGTVTLVAGTASYVLTPRPFRVTRANYKSASNVEIPMFDLTEDEYLDLPLKTSRGTPTNYFVDYQRAASTMYVWPVPSSVTTEVITYRYQRAFEDVDTLDDDLDIPAEYLETVGENLAVRCFSLFGKKDDELKQRAFSRLVALNNADREQVIRFVPEARR